jgi:metal-sulfur cluster biosynthetic enzyme
MNTSSEVIAESIREALRTVIDPEIGANIVDLGLVYRIDVSDCIARIEMTLTSSACPMGGVLLDDVDWKLRQILPPGIEPEVELVWTPAWTPQCMSESLRQQFGWNDSTRGE